MSFRVLLTSFGALDRLCSVVVAFPWYPHICNVCFFCFCFFVVVVVVFLLLFFFFFFLCFFFFFFLYDFFLLTFQPEFLRWTVPFLNLD